MSLQGKTTSGICRLSLANIKQGDFAALPPADPATAASASADPGETPSASPPPPPKSVCLGCSSPAPRFLWTVEPFAKFPLLRNKYCKGSDDPRLNSVEPRYLISENHGQASPPGHPHRRRAGPFFQGDAPAIERGKGRAFGQTRLFHRAKIFQFYKLLEAPISYA